MMDMRQYGGDVGMIRGQGVVYRYLYLPCNEGRSLRIARLYPLFDICLDDIGRYSANDDICTDEDIRVNNRR